MIAENLQKIKQEIRESCALVSRSPEEVKLVAVTKSVGSEEAAELVDLGVYDLAENRVDKLLEKKAALGDNANIKWHLIGNLQRRKVKNIINEIDYFHALENEKLAAEINKRAEKVVKCFIEINISGEESKYGIKAENLVEFVALLANYEKIEVVGLMTMAPLESSEIEVREIFSKLKKLQEKIEQQEIPYAPCHELSMGMSQDFQIAIESGTTFVRIGTALFRKD
ncbi:YggS family pyridoxal phosphate-dependent enzyme [Enterococcus sp. ALS3]|uniref:Pyridoxal phosphate homeostasis protein n=1 Tax=Enterococcus alishanensis TaxID=1303817 RepID=A0ABS6TAB8_9ENTE|nr:YggS family pyridoxal phosphate-dependent enzyme [Enterococcus alishanensis]MBV7389820.1 YggS family pyridoxal phosphate-dependent enzyme [Enterococcus alishanensis]